MRCADGIPKRGHPVGRAVVLVHVGQHSDTLLQNNGMATSAPECVLPCWNERNWGLVRQNASDALVPIATVKFHPRAIGWFIFARAPSSCVPLIVSSKYSLVLLYSKRRHSTLPPKSHGTWLTKIRHPRTWLRRPPYKAFDTPTTIRNASQETNQLPGSPTSDKTAA